MDLDLALARLDDELGAHARAWADEGAPPPAPPALVDASVRRVLARAAGQGDARAAAWLGACRLAAIEIDPAVVAMRAAAPAWDALVALTAARANAARAIGATALDVLVRDAFGVPALDAGADVPPAPARWRDDDVGLPAIERASLGRTFAVLARALGVAGAPRFAIGAQARTFVVTPGRDARVVVRAGASVARWSEALHELGHALVGLGDAARPSRTADEGAAAWVARHLERPAFVRDALGASDVLAGDVAAIARAAHARQIAQRARLALFEAALLRGESPPPPDVGVALARPPEPLWLDPGAQLAYAGGDVIAAARELQIAGARA